MVYQNIVAGQFVDRPNRFIAHVEINGVVETVHVKNTGRCRELLLPGVRVILEVAANPDRKTKYDLIAVYKQGFGLINMDSQAPNKVVAEWLAGQGYDVIKPEYRYGSSRIDFYMEKHRGTEAEKDKNWQRNEEEGKSWQSNEDSCDGEGQEAVEHYLMEVKGCTLEIDGIGYFPDAPTERGIKHLKELAGAVQQGYHCIMAYVIQMEGINEVRPNIATHPAYGKAVEEALAAGVKVLFLCTAVRENELRIVSSRYLEE